ncbi:MAG TPA: hypothetical protein VFZ37_08615 [Jiangellaceae bacterium]
MSSGVQSRLNDECAGDGYEVVELGYRRLDVTGPVVDIGTAEVIEPAPDPRRVDGPRLGARPASAPRRVGFVLVLTFVFGLVTGIVALQAHSDTQPDMPVALDVGSATADGTLVELSESFGVTAVTVPVHNAGSEDVTVHSFSFPGWQQDQFGSAREPVAVPAGQTRPVTTGAYLDCARPRPITPTVIEIRLRVDDLGVITMTERLAQPAHELPERWEQLCAAVPTP